MVIPLALIIWNWVRVGGRVALPFDHGGQKRGSWLGASVNLANCLPAILLGLVLAILSGPEKLSEPKTKRRLTNIEFCVDISGSMTAKFGEGSRYDASMAAIDEFLDFREGDAFGLTFFGNSVMHWCPLTTDTSAIRCSIPFMRPEVAPPWFGGTEIGKALRSCRKVLASREEGDRMIVLVSDGMSSDLSNGQDAALAKQLRDDDISVYAIHIGGGDAPAPIVNITSLTGGEVFVPGDPDALKRVFVSIDEMQETQLEKTAAERMDHYAPWCIAGLSVLAASVLTLFGLRYTPW